VIADPKCPGASTIIARTFTDGDFAGSHLLPRQSGTVHGLGRATLISCKFYSSRTSFAHTNTIESTWLHVKAILISYNQTGATSLGTLHVCSVVPKPQRRPVHHVNWYILLQWTGASAVRITADDVSRLFVVLCAPHVAKFPNY
jgi:hypothetical protein